VKGSIEDIPERLTRRLEGLGLGVAPWVQLILFVMMVVTGSPRRRCSRWGEVHPEPPGHGLGQGREDDFVKLLTLQQLTDRLERIRIPQVAVYFDAQTTKVAQELAQPVAGMRGCLVLAGRNANGRDEAFSDHAPSEVSSLVLGTRM
jgi:hypothetical protein